MSYSLDPWIYAYISLLPQGITLVISEVIPRKDLEMSYQRMIPDIADLLRALRIDNPKATFKATSKAAAKAKWPCRGSQGEGPSKKSKIWTSSASYSPSANFGH